MFDEERLNGMLFDSTEAEKLTAQSVATKSSGDGDDLLRARLASVSLSLSIEDKQP